MEPLMDKHALAEYLGIPVKTAEAMITARQCPRITWVGKHARFDPADVRAWVEQQKEGAGRGLRLAPGPSWPPTTNPPPAGPNTPPPPAGPKFPRERAA